MKDISFFKKISLFFVYRKIVKSLKRDLETDFGARIDKAYRIYTVINIPETLIEEPYNLRKADIDNLAKNFLKEYSNTLSQFLNKKGLIELYDFYEVEKVEKYSYLLIFGFSLFNTQKLLRQIYLIWIPFISLSLIGLLIYFLNF
jgi:hypothetical protein